MKPQSHSHTVCDYGGSECTEQRASRRSLTVKLLDGQLVIQVQLEAVNVPHWALVVRLHDGRVRGGVGQAQRMTKLVHGHREQVGAAAVATYGRVKQNKPECKVGRLFI